MRQGRKCGSNLIFSYVLFEKKFAKKSFVQFHVFAQSPPGRHLHDKYPIKHFAPLPISVEMFHTHCYLVASTIHTQSVRSQMRVYMHIFFTI